MCGWAQLVCQAIQMKDMYSAVYIRKQFLLMTFTPLMPHAMQT